MTPPRPPRENSGMDSPSFRRSRAAVITIVTTLAVCLLLAIYVASSAPAFGLVFSGDMRRDRFDTIYAPLGFVADRMPPVKRRLHAYWEWWLSSFGYYPSPPEPVSPR